MWVLATFSVVLVLSISAQQVCYVKPDDYPVESCPGQPCLTLEQYAQQSKQFFIASATFLFLAGNHTLETTVELTNVSSITLKGNNSDSTIALTCTFILGEHVKNLTIEGLMIELNSSDIYQEYAALSFSESTNILISKLTFQGNGNLSSSTGTTAVHSRLSSVTIVSCLFDGNTGLNGGALKIIKSSVTLFGSIFRRNKARCYGGAIFADRSYVSIDSENLTVGASQFLHDLFLENHIPTPGSALFFKNEAYDRGGAMYLQDSSVFLSGTVIKFTNNSARESGGAMFFKHILAVTQLVTNVKHLYFTGNKAHGTTYTRAGAIYADGASLIFGESAKNFHHFLNNFPTAIFCKGNDNVIKITGNSFFISNGYYNYHAGGAIRILGPEITLKGNAIFHYNLAKDFGGAISLEFANAVFDGANIEFKYNSASDGGAIYSTNTNLTIRAEQLTFIGNTATQTGGALRMYNAYPNFQARLSGVFINNTAGDCGGAMSIVNVINITLVDITATGNSGCALCIASTNVTFTSTTRITNNSGKFGGAINVKNSNTLFRDRIEIENNSASLGGAIYSLYGQITFQRGVRNGPAQFQYNKAEKYGGALYATGTIITLKRLVHFEYNSAQNGGVIYFNTAARLNLYRGSGAVLSTAYNHASEYGGVLYHEDEATFIQCEFVSKGDAVLKADELPYCPLQFGFGGLHLLESPATSNLNTAKRGKFMYGGLLDRCRLSDNLGKEKHAITALEYLNWYSSLTNLTIEMASSPYQLCFCENNVTYNCTGEKSLSVYRGQLVRISLIAFDQMTTAVSTPVTASTNSTARLELGQNPQLLPQTCHNLTYNLYSTETREQVVLYPDGPCHATGLARAVLNMVILPCPDGFNLSTSGEQCECEKRLQVYGAQCIINDTIYITKVTGSKFWMGSLNINGTYQGLVLYRICPIEYCEGKSVNVTLDNPDIQCGYNRSGLLCGECASNYSLLLGGFRCKLCSNTNYLALLVPFAAAGIVLVAFLSVLHLTVATGMLNSIILYANIVQVNKNLFFASSETNVLTVFIAWLNLDFGFQTCFYHGMDAYAVTWLQYAFPLYVWILISLIILTSRYSIIVSKLIGHNPIAVLATLLLMSYTKILKIVIEVYASVDLDYPNDKKVTVWLKDANVPYLHSKHLVLAVVTSLVLVFFFLPYTFLLLIGHKLYGFTRKKGLRWLNRIKPLLDSYYAPYKLHTRYWTGLLLLVRCALYIVFSFNSLGASTESLLAINIVFTTLVIIAWLSVQIYESFLSNIIEASVYLNLIILSTATLAGANTTPLANSLISVVFVTTTGVTVYHFHAHYTAKSWMWLQARARMVRIIEKVKTLTSHTTATPDPLIDIPASSHDPHRIVSKTVLDIREPLLEY